LQSLATVVEKTTAAYVQGDFNGDDLFGLSWGGNLGVRFVHTEEASVGYGQILTDITAIPNDPTGDNAIYANSGATIKQGASSSYNYALPSLNFRLNLPRDLVLRAAASKSLARPEPNQLTPVVNYGGGILAPTNLAATGGNPNLRPYTSVNYDLGLEWYYQPGGYLAIDGFDKKLTNFIEYVESPLSVPIVNSEHLPQFANNVATFNLTAPTNIGSANVHGVELSAQHMFNYLPSPFDGFGINANATILSTNAGINSGSGAGSSTQTFGLTGLGDYQNLTLIYQKYGFGMRLAYSHRNTYIYQIGDPYNDLAPIYIKGYGELDAQVSYQINEHVIVALSGTNLTKSVLQEYDTRPDEFLSLLNYGARYELSVRAAF
ncbi:MAG: TonB-dependent receptor, partial [Steroidobacteraceae bacterium]